MEVQGPKLSTIIQVRQYVTGQMCSDLLYLKAWPPKLKRVKPIQLEILE